MASKDEYIVNAKKFLSKIEKIDQVGTAQLEDLCADAFAAFQV